jgi:hypothetical protein
MKKKETVPSVSSTRRQLEIAGLVLHLLNLEEVVVAKDNRKNRMPTDFESASVLNYFF